MADSVEDLNEHTYLKIFYKIPKSNPWTSSWLKLRHHACNELFIQLQNQQLVKIQAFWHHRRFGCHHNLSYHLGEESNIIFKNNASLHAEEKPHPWLRYCDNSFAGDNKIFKRRKSLICHFNASCTITTFLFSVALIDTNKP